MLFVDLEATFLRKGFKRRHQQILEIGMACGNRTYQCLVNPIGRQPIVSRLLQLGQDPKRTVRFWTKLLVDKKYLPCKLRQKSMTSQAAAIEALLRNKELFRSPKEAMDAAVKFSRSCKATTWIAHNGKSFDFHILRAHLTDTPYTVAFVDSLPLIRLAVDLPSHSQPLVYKHLFQTKYPAHQALHDALALQKICQKLRLDMTKTTTKTKTKTKTNTKNSELLSLHGVGPKSVAVLNQHHIYTIKQLRKAASLGKTFPTVRHSVLARLNSGK